MRTPLFDSLELRVRELEEHYLPKEPNPLGDYDGTARDDAHACLLLAHAEFESYFESMSFDLADAAVTSIGSESYDGFTSHFLLEAGRKSIEVNGGPGKGKTLGEYACFLCNQVKKCAIGNHGIRQKNLEKLFSCYGYKGEDIDAAFEPDLDSFGAQRGELAHRGIGQIQKEINPYEARCSIDNAMTLIEKFDAHYAGYLLAGTTT